VEKVAGRNANALLSWRDIDKHTRRRNFPVMEEEYICAFAFMSKLIVIVVSTIVKIYG